MYIADSRCCGISELKHNFSKSEGVLPLRCRFAYKVLKQESWRVTSQSSFLVGNVLKVNCPVMGFMISLSRGQYFFRCPPKDSTESLGGKSGLKVVNRLGSVPFNKD